MDRSAAAAPLRRGRQHLRARPVHLLLGRDVGVVRGTNLAAIVETYLAGAPPDLVVYLEIDPAVAMERIGRRVSNDNLVLPSYAEPPLTEFRDALETVAPLFAAGGVDILRLDAESTVEANVKAVADRLAELGF